jgi:hypothetical protein
MKCSASLPIFFVKTALAVHDRGAIIALAFQTVKLSINAGESSKEVLSLQAHRHYQSAKRDALQRLSR